MTSSVLIWRTRITMHGSRILTISPCAEHQLGMARCWLRDTQQISSLWWARQPRRTESGSEICYCWQAAYSYQKIHARIRLRTRLQGSKFKLQSFKMPWKSKRPWSNRNKPKNKSRSNSKNKAKNWIYIRLLTLGRNQNGLKRARPPTRSRYHWA